MDLSEGETPGSPGPSFKESRKAFPMVERGLAHASHLISEQASHPSHVVPGLAWKRIRVSTKLSQKPSTACLIAIPALGLRAWVMQAPVYHRGPHRLRPGLPDSQVKGHVKCVITPEHAPLEGVTTAGCTDALLAAPNASPNLSCVWCFLTAIEFTLIVYNIEGKDLHLF